MGAVSVERTLISQSMGSRLPGILKAVAAVSFYAFFGAWIYSGFSADFNDVLLEFPDELVALMGGSLVGSTGGYIGNVMVNLIGPVLFITLAAAYGANVIAGEESNQTARLLFSQPISRRTVMATRSFAMLLSIAIGVAIFAASLGIATTIFDGNPPTTINLIATGVHLFMFAATIGMLSLGIASATGSKMLALATAGGVAFASYVINSFAPLTSLEGLERFTPWYFFNGNEPLDNGFDIVSLVILAVLMLVFFLVGWFFVDSRDLEIGPRIEIRKLVGSRVGAERVTSVFARTVSAASGPVLAASAVLLAMAVSMALLFASVGEAFNDIGLPSALEDAFGGESLGSAAGWMNTQFASIVAPLLVLAVAVTMGLDAIAGERESRTLMITLPAAGSRKQFFAQKLAAIVAAVVVMAAIAIAGLFIGTAVASLDLAPSDIFGSGLHLGALGLLFGSVAITAGVLLPRGTALSVTAGLAAASFLSQTLLSAVDGPSWLIKLTPWEYYTGNNPLANGPSVTNLTVLLALTIGIAVVGAVAFERVDAA